MRGFLLLGSALVVLVSAGCAKKDNTESVSTEQGAPATESSPQATSQPLAGEHGGGEEQVNTSGSVADIIGRVHEQEQQLGQIIASAQLSDVHKKAFAIRDLIVAAAAKAGGSEVSKAKLQTHVDEVKTLASALDEAGDSGDLGKTKTEYQRLQTHLRAIEGALGAATP